MSSEDETLKDAYRPFSKRLSFSDFKKKVNALSIDKWNFVRASFLYQQALKCKECEPNIAMVLLCSCADALKVAGAKAGSHNNFNTFYINFCPTSLRDSPLGYYPNKKPPKKDAPFKITLDFIYAKFRCLYVHEGKGRLSTVPEDVKSMAFLLLDVYKGVTYSMDTIKLHNWFEKITLESLYNML